MRERDGWSAGSRRSQCCLMGCSWQPWRSSRSPPCWALKAQHEERARRLELEREENARHAVEGERTRIARELHDIVAHHVSAIAVQAGAAGEIAERDPLRAREALQFIQDASRHALVEMRAM